VVVLLSSIWQLNQKLLLRATSRYELEMMEIKKQSKTEENETTK
jgi:hypothetical protein